MGKLMLNDRPYTGQASGDGLHVYSTNEQIVGKWINGKPLYEKTFTTTITTSETVAGNIKFGTVQLPSELSSLEHLFVDVEHSFYSPVTGQERGFLYAFGEPEENDIIVATMYARTAAPATITIQYVKS